MRRSSRGGRFHALGQTLLTVLSDLRAPFGILLRQAHVVHGLRELAAEDDIAVCEAFGDLGAVGSDGWFQVRPKMLCYD